MVDSAELGGKGDFRFVVRLPEGRTTLYNLRHDQGAIPLLLSAGERAEVSSVCDIALNYTVEGSEESARIRELQMLLMHGGLLLDSLRQVIFSSEGEPQREAYAEYVGEMNRIKRSHLSFIASEPARLSSLYALYQRLAGEQHLFSAENDIIYYRMVADSTAVDNPGSPYVAALRKEVADAEKVLEVNESIAEKWRSGGIGYPDLVLPDMYGREHTLSDLDGKVVLVDFWHSADPASRLNNGELRSLYEAAHDRGFEVYQVSLDTQKAAWVAAVQDQRLPWLSVGDMLGEAGPAALRYNVRRLPANFLIGRDGMIVGRDLFGKRLSQEVDKLL